VTDLAKLRIWDDPATRGALSWYLDVAENRQPAKFRIATTVATQLDPAASSEARSGQSSIGSRRSFLRGGRRSGRARRCRRRLGRACWSCVASLPTACSRTVTSARGTAALTGSRVPSSAPASSPPVPGSARISTTPVRSCSTAARRALARSSSPPATCAAPFARTGTSALTRITACAGSHYWGREIRKLGHEVRLSSLR
jgi:hypothetical protein